MLDIKFLRENPEIVKENIKKKFQFEKINYVDEVIDALAFLESIPDEELLSFIKNNEPTYETMDEIEKAYISKYEEFSGYKDYIFNISYINFYSASITVSNLE